MARTVEEIRNGMTTDFMSNETLAAYYGFTVGDNFDAHFSKVNLESILFFIVASAIWVVEKIFDQQKKEVNEALGKRITHNKQWYADLAKQFQYGDALNLNSGTYDTIDEEKQIIAHASVDEVAGKLIMKVAKSDGTSLEPLEGGELSTFTNYIEKVKDAGVSITVRSLVGDSLNLVIDIWYDPLVMNDQGELLTDSSKPVEETLQNFIQNLPFNGEFQLVKLVDALQATEGVVIPNILSAESKYADNDWVTIDAKVKPYAGYLTLETENLTINYRAYDGD